ncbi:MAG: type II toxin-antitoxin system ParD family antitoxin [Sphingobium sp.]|nr:type II toxin-antitoxin system ParD family antitoxin [Sphingobium sp.]
MTDMSFTMPPDLKSWIDAQVAQGRYADAGDYLRDLVRRDLDAADEDTRWLRSLIAEGTASGTIDKAPDVVIEEIIAERRARRG